MSVQNPNRARAKLIISLIPGIHLRGLQRLLGTSFSTTRHHVRSLEHEGEIVSSEGDRRHRLYPVGMSENMRMVYAALQSETARRVLRALADTHGGLTNGEISAAVDVPRSTISECTATLCSADLVSRSNTIDGQVLYDLGDRERASQLVAAFEKNLLSVVTNSFVDLWDL